MSVAALKTVMRKLRGLYESTNAAKNLLYAKFTRETGKEGNIVSKFECLTKSMYDYIGKLTILVQSANKLSTKFMRLWPVHLHRYNYKMPLLV